MRRFDKRGINNTPAGEAHHARKLDEFSVARLRSLVAKGVCIKCATKILGIDVAYSTAWDAANYHSWRHVR